tara:strand:+ start:4064 stop:4507 length:444 start_codon:yes stop_codon:yes gene_type:complete
LDEKLPNVIGLASDHAGYDLKENIKAELIKKNIQIIDQGTFSNDSVDYPDYGKLLGAIVSKREVKYGIAICGSGIGISIALNRISGVRAALCHNKDMVKLARLHNNANVIVFGSRFINFREALDLISIFDKENFEGGRHVPRVKKLG